jgi:hypothetical protein
MFVRHAIVKKGRRLAVQISQTRPDMLDMLAG